MRMMERKMTYRASDPPVCPRLCLSPIPTPSTCGTRMTWWSPYHRTTAPRWALCCWPLSRTSPRSSPHPAPTTAYQCPTVPGRCLLSHGTSEAGGWKTIFWQHDESRPKKTGTAKDKSCTPKKMTFQKRHDILNPITFTFMQNVIQRDFQCIQTTRFTSLCFPWESNP